MKIDTIINKYIFRQMLPPFIINLSFLTFVFLMAQILEITNLVVNYKVSIIAMVRLLIYSMPAFLEFTIPMSVMMGVLLTFLQMSNDNEIIALRAGGINLYQLLPPVILFCMGGFFLTLIITVYGVSWGNLSYKKLAIDLATSSFEVGFKERTFNDSFDGLMLYVNKVDIKNKTFRDIFIEDQRNDKMTATIVAPKGSLIAGQDPFTYTLKLHQGVINQTTLSTRSVHSIRFDTYEINMGLDKSMEALKKDKKRQEEMSLKELKAVIAQAPMAGAAWNSAVMKLHEKFAIPFACIALGILAVPLGLQSVSFKKSSGIGFGFVFFLIYYLMLAAGLSLGETGIYPPVFAMWTPNIVMGSISIFLLVRTAKEGPIFFNFPPGLFGRSRRRRVQAAEG